MKMNKRAGFTLIEMMLVIVIIGLLVTAVGINITKQSKSAKVGTAQAQIAHYKLSLSAYNLDNGVFPTSEQGMAALLAPPATPPVPTKWHGPYLDPAVIRDDPWGRPYVYVCPAQQNPDAEGFDLYSLGPDGQANTADDIVSWR